MTCKCVDNVNDGLKDKNCALDMISLMNMEDGTVRQSLRIPTFRLDRSVKRWTRNVIPAYCPFCGVKILEDQP